MSIRKFFLLFGGVLGVAGLLAAGWTREHWQGYLFPPATAPAPADDPHPHGGDRIRLSPQAQRTLDLKIDTVQLQPYWRKIQVPATVIEQPGHSDHGLNTPLAGVIERILAVPGEVVRPGQELFAVRLVSEYLQNSQTELYKTVREKQINEDWTQRLQRASSSIPETRLLEVENQQRRLEAREKALRFDLAARGLTPQQVQDVSEGDFVTSIVIRAPNPIPASPAEAPPLYDLEELKVHVGDPVQPGQSLGLLAHHRKLLLQARAYPHEVPLLRRAAKAGWAVEADFPDADPDDWPRLPPLKIQSFGNRVDPESQTLPVYVPLPNQYREHADRGKTFRTWRFRPAQRVYLRVPVREFEKVFVLPAEAVAREGAENYVFVQNGKVFDRIPVTVLHRDARQVVVANDGSIIANVSSVVQGAAPQLQRALQLKASGGGGGHHHHHH